MIFKYSTFT
jgi:hypothetical protein